MNTILKYLLYCATILFSLSVVCIVAIILFINFSDLNNYRDDIAEAISKSSGQKIQINGDFEAKISLHPSLTASNVTVTNASWETKKPMISIQKFHAQLNWKSIFGRLIIDKFILHNATILLENKKGKNNFYANPKNKKTKQKKSLSINNIFKKIPIIYFADVKNTTLYSNNHDNKRNYTIPIRSISIVGQRSKADIDINIGDIKSNNESLGNLTTKATLTPNSLVIHSIKQGNAIDGNFEYYNQSKIHGDIKINNFNAEIIDILAPKKQGLVGKINGRIVFNANGKNKKTMMESLSGQIKLQSQNIAFTQNLPFILNIINISNFNNTTSGCFLIEAPITKGIADVNAISVLNIGDIKTQGTVNFIKENLNLKNDINVETEILTTRQTVEISGNFDDIKTKISKEGSINLNAGRILDNVGSIFTQLLDNDTKQVAEPKNKNLPCRERIKS